MDKRNFQLKPSLIALVFQFAIFTVLMALLYQVVAIWLWCILLLLGLVIYALFYRKRPNISALEYLDGRDWTLTKYGQPQRVQISHIIDHQVYIVVYFQHARTKPMIIWCDQVAVKQWKSLKVLAKMI